jgi:acetyltransferase-like isoleucine patch superfamily enzyme
MKYRFKIIGVFRKIFLFFLFKINPIKCSEFIGVTIGDNCKIYGGNPNMWGTEPFLIKIGNNVHITDGCRFVTHDGGTLILRKYTPDLEVTSPITIGNDVYLGVETIVMPGVHIDNNVIVGARSIVTKNIESNSVVVGIPAKKIKTVDEYHEKLKLSSLKIGHLSRDRKERELKRIFLKK